MSNDEHKQLCGVEWGAEWRPLPRSHLDPSQAALSPTNSVSKKEMLTQWEFLEQAG